MKAKELRIGNLVNVSVIDQNVSVSAISKDTIRVNDNILAILKYDQIEPIVLTEKWMQKLGFKYSKMYGWFENKDTFIKISKEFNLYFSYPRTYKELTFVHELQNLYFALTGKELTLK